MLFGLLVGGLFISPMTRHELNISCAQELEQVCDPGSEHNSCAVDGDSSDLWARMAAAIVPGNMDSGSKAESARQEVSLALNSTH